MSDRRLRPAAWIGFLAVSTVLLALSLLPEPVRVAERERMFDLALALSPRPASTGTPPIVIADIDRDSLKALGAWPWRRGLVADLIEQALKGGAIAVGVDILFPGADQRSPGSVARRLAEETGDPALRDAATRLEDGDKRLAAAIDDQPVALGLLLDPAGRAPAAQAQILTRGNPALPDIWSASGVEGPLRELLEAASGVGVASLPADPDGVVRRLPVLTRVGDALVPGLAAEAARLAAEASGYLLTGPGAILTLGEAVIPLPSDGMVRLSRSFADGAITTIPAHLILSGTTPNPAFKGAIVLIGSSAPEAGGLRISHIEPLISSTRLQAIALRQLVDGVAPRRLPQAQLLEPALGALAGCIAVLLGLRLRPASGAAALALLLLAISGSTIVLASMHLLFDPAAALAAAAAGFLSTSLAVYSLTRQREAAMRRRFEQHLAPGVVARIAASPESLKLGGERRRVTALFTDIEGFSTMTTQASPEALIAILDGYFEGVARIVVDRGGMIDKFVGDAVHAIFNAPLDLPSHTDQAILCAQDVLRWTETFRTSGVAAEQKLGRTRIGVEEGDVVVGDVGLATKLDYTAHGPAVNLAARLEALNKELGTSICIGPSAASLTTIALRPLGPAAIRGVGMMEVFTIGET